MDKEEIIGFDALYNSMMKCKNGVRWKGTTGFYLHHWPTEVARLEDALKSGKYKQRPAKFFNITDPKPREIMSIHFRDRVYQRSLNDVALYPQASKRFIPDNFACQKGKGTDAARDRLKEYLQKYYRKYGADGYVLKIDIKGYYPNMDRTFASEMLKSYTDPVSFDMAHRIITEFPGETGFNPGSQIIQIIGITALDKVDHFIKERLRMKFYIRYMDDFILIHQCRAHLEVALKAVEGLLNKQKMTLNHEKTRITKLKGGIRFLGFIFRLTNSGKVVVTVMPEKIKREKKKVRRMIKLYKNGEMTKRALMAHWKSWKASVRYGDSHKLIEKLNRWFEAELEKEMPCRSLNVKCR